MHVEARLKPTWDWILTVMDATEAQLRFGASLTHTSDPSHPSHPLHPLNPASGQSAGAASTLGGTAGGIGVLGGPITTRRNAISLENPPSGVGSAGSRIVGFSSGGDNQRNYDRDTIAQNARREFLTYALSLMRSHSSEHRDSLPVLDVTALRHIAYVLDGIVFYMRSAKENDVSGGTGTSTFDGLPRGSAAPDINLWPDVDENENDDDDDDLQLDGGGADGATGGVRDGGEFGDSSSQSGSLHGRRQSFFQRSESTLCLGCPPPDPFNTPMFESLPLADQPHLLQPNARREDLFGIPKQPITIAPSGTEPPGVNSPLELPPTQLGLSPHATTGPNGVSLFSAAATAAATAATSVAAVVEPAVSSRPFADAIASASNSNTATIIQLLESVAADAADEQQQPQTSSAAAQVIKSLADATNQAGPSKPREDAKDAGSGSATAVKRKMPEHSEGFGNIYMQLKKKNFYTIYEQQYSSDDARSSGAYEKKDGKFLLVDCA